MPYQTIQDLNEPTRRVLPEKAQKIFLDAFNKAWYEKELPEPRCFQYAWKTLKNKGYRKNHSTGLWFKPNTVKRIGD